MRNPDGLLLQTQAGLNLSCPRIIDALLLLPYLLDLLSPELNGPSSPQCSCLSTHLALIVTSGRTPGVLHIICFLQPPPGSPASQPLPLGPLCASHEHILVHASLSTYLQYPRFLQFLINSIWSNAESHCSGVFNSL